VPDDSNRKDVEATTTLIKKDWQKRLAAIRRDTPTPSGAEAKITAPPPPDSLVDQASPSLVAPEPSLPPFRPAETVGAPPGREGTVEPSPAPAHHRHPGGEASALVIDHLENLGRQQRRQSLLSWAILGMLGLLLATQVFFLVRPQPLDLRDQMARLRALDLRPPGSFGLSPDDRGQPGWAQLTPWPHRDLKLTVEDKPGLPGQRASQAQALPPNRGSAAKVVYVGSKNSNKYHYPACKWAKQIKPRGLITFTSVEEARHRHYVPCPACKPPPLGPER
jgi:hypothetical protein